MKSTIGSFGGILLTVGITLAQTPSRTVDSYLGEAKLAAGMDWAGTFLRLCGRARHAG
jgi:hypothetical protein